MRLGVVISIYNGMEFLEEFLKPWIEAKKELDIKIVFIDAKFENFDGETNSTDGTTEYLINKLNCGLIDYYGYYYANKKEHEVRNVGINMLVDMGCHYILSTAPDEIFTVEQIKYIYNYIQWDKNNVLFKLSYKNYVDSKNTYVLNFEPKRIWKVYLDNYKFNGLVFDDDGSYINPNNGNILLDNDFPSTIISDIKIKHYSWLSNQNSINKINYQEKRWSKNSCSYKWNNETQKIEFNLDYYRKIGQNPPIIYKDE